MGKKPTYWKKLSPILEEAEDFINDKLFKEAVEKLKEAINFINLKVKEPEERDKEIKSITSKINQVYSEEIKEIVNQSYRMTEKNNLDNAIEMLNQAIIITENIDDPDFKKSEITNINKLIGDIKLRLQLEEGLKLKDDKKFDEAIEIFKKALEYSIEIHGVEPESKETTNIKNLITQAYSTQIKLMVDEGVEIKQGNNFDNAIEIFKKALNIVEKIDDAEQKKDEIDEINKILDETYVIQVNPLFEEGKDLIDREKVDDAIPIIKKAEILVNEMNDPVQKKNELKKLSDLINPILIDKLKSFFEKGSELIKQDKFEESVTTINEASKYLSQALNIAKELIESDEKIEEIKTIINAINRTCSAGIDVRKEKAKQLLEIKQFEAAIGELYSGLSIAKNMACDEVDNVEAEDLKKIINQVYSAEINKFIEQGKEFIESKNYDEATNIFKNALDITNKMYLSAETDNEISRINDFIDQIKVKKIVAKGDLLVGKEKFEKEIGKFKESLDNANRIKDPVAKKEKISTIKKSIDQIYSSEINLIVEQANQLSGQNEEKQGSELLEQALNVTADIENVGLKNKEISNIIKSLVAVGRHLLTRDKFDNAFEDLERALEIANTITDENIKTNEISTIKDIYKQKLNEKAEQDIQGNQYEKAIKRCKKAIDLDSKFVEPYYNMGIAYQNENKEDLALKNFQRVVELENNHLKAWNNMGILYEIKGDYESALKAYGKAVEIDLLEFLKINRKVYFEIESKRK